MSALKTVFKSLDARRSRSAAMPFIMVTTLIDMMSIGLIIPVLPALVGSFTGTQRDQALWFGAVTFTFASPIFLHRRYWARYRTVTDADRYCWSDFAG